MNCYWSKSSSPLWKRPFKVYPKKGAFAFFFLPHCIAIKFNRFSLKLHLLSRESVLQQTEIFRLQISQGFGQYQRNVRDFIQERNESAYNIPEGHKISRYIIREFFVNFWNLQREGGTLSFHLMVLVKNSISTWRRKLLFKFFSLVPLAHIQGLTYTSTKTTYVLCSWVLFV